MVCKIRGNRELGPWFGIPNEELQCTGKGRGGGEKDVSY